MKAKLFDKSGKEKSAIELPKIFSARVRADILAKVFETMKFIYAQAYGIKKGAGSQYSASGILKHQRHDWKTTYGKGISRVPRKIMSRSGDHFNWVGATVANTRGGRRPHGPRSERNPFKKINKKELSIAFNSAFAGTVNSEFIEKKYGIKAETGFVFTSDVLKMKTKDFFKILEAVFKESYSKILKIKTQRAGKGKARGRRYKSNAGLLFVVGSNESMQRKGIDVVKVNELKIMDIAPNGEPGRFTCYTESAIKEIGEKFK